MVFWWNYSHDVTSIDEAFLTAPAADHLYIEVIAWYLWPEQVQYSLSYTVCLWVSQRRTKIQLRPGNCLHCRIQIDGYTEIA